LFVLAMLTFLVIVVAVLSVAHMNLFHVDCVKSSAFLPWF
jgi:hypothetical protein